MLAPRAPHVTFLTGQKFAFGVGQRLDLARFPKPRNRQGSEARAPLKQHHRAGMHNGVSYTAPASKLGRSVFQMGSQSGALLFAVIGQNRGSEIRVRPPVQAVGQEGVAPDQQKVGIRLGDLGHKPPEIISTGGIPRQAHDFSATS